MPGQCMQSRGFLVIGHSGSAVHSVGRFTFLTISCNASYFSASCSLGSLFRFR